MMELRVFELLVARLCHELVSPVGAINNGIELLEEDDPDFVRDALKLIGESGRKAAQRLQFYRFAYGTIASGGGPVASGEELAQALFAGTKLRCEWAAPPTLAPEWQRLGCNLLALAAEVLPRGGSVVLRPAGAGIETLAEGEGVNLSAEARAAIERTAPVSELTARTVQGYFAAGLAEALGSSLAVVEAGPQRALFRAAPRA